MTISEKWHGFDLTEDQLEVLDWVREFCQKEIRPAGPKYHKLEDTPWDIIKKAAACGIYSVDFFGQLFADSTGLTAALAIEELFHADAGIALSIFGTGLPAAAIMANGTPKQIAQWLPKCFGTAKDPKLAAFCTSETDAGSDVSGMRTTAVYDEKSDTWTIKGTKDWITNGGVDGVHVVVASVDQSLGSRGQASFVVPPGTKGLSQGSKHHKLGFRASLTAEVLLDNVVVPGDCLLGGKEKLDKRLEKARKGVASGGQAAMATFEGTRWMVAAMGVGIARAAYEYARDYARIRVAFGKSIAEHQQVAEMLADMATEIYLARLGVIDAARTYLSTLTLSKAQGSKVKYYASELAVRATRMAVQILGGAGYVEDHPVAQWYGDAPLLTIFEGTSQIQKNLIASVETGLRIR
jgi:alkylation response protein AidB-like acyl-CoA dehydrogenase